MFNPSDVYTSSGSNQIYGCWPLGVSKFDSSSFYNWEQDNQPVYDLEERTSLLWERLGHPTSAVTGFSLVVSADTVSACNSNVFTSLSSALAKLPEVINSPYLIEVASFGQLGYLNLSNKVFGPRGSIEIINRLFAKGHAAINNGTILNNQVSATNSAYGLASAIQITAGGGGAYPTAYRQLLDSSAVSISTRVVSSTAGLDTRFTNNLTVFCRKTFAANQRLTAALAAKNTTAPWTGVPSLDKIAFLHYEQNAESGDQINSFDASCINELTSTENIWDSVSNSNESNALVYANRLDGIKIHNCNGPIFIRGFTVDGGGFGGREFGIDIRNSTVYTEDCSVSRCSKAGLHAVDSNVTILRSFVAYRNYGYLSNGNRQGNSWVTKLASQTYSASSPLELGAGILAINSDINFSSTYTRDQSIFSGTIANFYPLYVIAGYAPPMPAHDWLVCLSKNEIGIHAINSTVRGGKPETGGIGAFPIYDAQFIYSELNTDSGIRLSNSKLHHSGKINLLGNFIGLDSDSSDIKLDCLVAKYNQKEGVRLKNTSLKYNKDLYLPSNNNVADDYNLYQNSFFYNGTHIRLDNSTYEPTDTSSMPAVYEVFAASGAFGIEQNLSNQKSKLPSIIVDSNSRLRIVHPVIETPDAFLEEKRPLYGASIAVTNNSELVLQGSKSYVSKIIGPSTYNLQKRKAGLYAGNNSTIKIQGPTVIAKYAVDALADNNSTLEITPHRTSNGSLDVSGFNLTDSGNHTIVELHSSRACLVADHASNIVMQDLGDYREFWRRGSYGSSVLLSGIDYLTSDSAELNSQLYTSAGSIQFYPNPNDSDHYPPATANPTIPFHTAVNMTLNPQGYYYYLEDDIGSFANNQNFSSVTLGGMCVRLVNNSVGDINNVHFPCGWWNPSGIIYDVSGAEAAVACNRLFIWNIADLSQLNAKLISVSGLHPADAAYFGPSGVWGTASAAPTTTPDTSSVSILDYYGRSTNHLYSRSTAANQGPFRLFFSTDPAANWLVTSAMNLSGYAAQVFSQGYQFSGNLVAPGTVSSFHMSLIKQNGNTLTPSGFYYGSAMLHSPNTVKAVLDDSASNTFANAKHCSVGKSGLGKVVSIYFPYTEHFGGDSARSAVKQYGRGLRSVNNFDLEKDN
jgi:hypothetical protein